MLQVLLCLWGWKREVSAESEIGGSACPNGKAEPIHQPVEGVFTLGTAPWFLHGATGNATQGNADTRNGGSLPIYTLSSFCGGGGRRQSEFPYVYRLGKLRSSKENLDSDFKCWISVLT